MVNKADLFVDSCIIHVNNIGSSRVFHYDSLRQVNLMVLWISRNARFVSWPLEGANERGR